MVRQYVSAQGRPRLHPLRTAGRGGHPQHPLPAFLVPGRRHRPHHLGAADRGGAACVPRSRREQRRAGRHIARRFPPHTAIHDRLYIRPQTRRRRRERSTVVPHAALETGVRHRGIALGDPPALAPAHSRGRGRQTRQPGAGHLQVETRGKPTGGSRSWRI